MRFVADENLNGDVLRGVRARRPHVDIVRVQNAGLSGASDPDLLDWAARHDRIVITHDVATLVGFAYRRIKAGLPMPGVMVVSDTMTIGEAIALIALVTEATDQADWTNQVRYLPL